MQESLTSDWLINDWQFGMHRCSGVWRNDIQKENATNTIHGRNIFLCAAGLAATGKWTAFI